MILVVDNYDSFVYNLVQRLGELGCDSRVFRNDAVTLEEIEAVSPSHIIISPGPCTPLEAGISNEVVRYFKGRIPILGVCLGHQCIGHIYGGRIVRASVPVHGKASPVFHDGRTVFKGLPSPMVCGRYHSLIIDRNTIPATLEVTALTGEGEIMGVRNEADMVEGLQIHPESILTDHGHGLLRNFLNTYSSKFPAGQNNG